VSVTKGVLGLNGDNNGNPRAYLTKPLPADDIACEIEFDYPAQPAINLTITLFRAPSFSLDANDVEETTQLVLPDGGGTNLMYHHFPKDGTPNAVLAATPYHAPVVGRKYVARIETVGDTLRVFLDGGLLLKAKKPHNAQRAKLPQFLGFGLHLASANVHAVRVNQIASK
jgi:hypothetical protein